jgi:glycosyltransferase involved in cell wall biosynthesis
MKIGIDAKWYFEGPPSGQMVVRNLVNALIECESIHEIILFLDEKYTDAPLDRNSGKVKKIYIWAKNNLISNLLCIPLASRKYELDVLIYQNFVSIFGRYKKIAYIHDIIFLTHPEYYTLIERLYFFPMKYLTRRADHVITVSVSEKNRLIEYNYRSKGSVYVVYHGVDGRFKPHLLQPQDLLEKLRKRFHLPEKFILYVGRLNSRKNVPNLLRGFSNIRDKGIPLVLVGGYDWKSDDIESVIKKLSLKERLVFTGPVYGDDLGALYSLATLFCFPSFEESFGLPPLEAMASGVPVIVSSSSSLPEICADAGTYIDPNSPESITKSIDELLSNEELYNRKKELGILQAKKFQWKNSARNMIDLIEKMK